MGAPELPKTEKEQLLQFLLSSSTNGKPAHGKINEAATLFNICRKTVSRIWATAKQQMEKGEVIHVPMNRKGRKRKHEVDNEQIQNVHYQKRVCRPLFGSDGSVIFDGKIGIWPFTEEVEAKRGSKRRPKGTKETKPIQSITKQVIKDCVIKQIIPAIKRVWPSSLSKVISIQQDNAKPHIKDTDLDFRAAASSDGFEISLIQQPPNSPDTNVNDLGFFKAIQSIQQEEVCRDAPQLVNAVVSSFNQLEATTLNKVFLSLQCCMKEILKVKGHNNYKMPHMKKDALIRQNALPDDLEVPEELVRESINHLIQAGRAGGIAELMADLNMDAGVDELLADLNMDAGVVELLADLNIDAA